MDKIYSRKRLLFPNFKLNKFKGNNPFNKSFFNNEGKNNIYKRKILNIVIIIFIAIVTMYKIIEAVNVIIEKQCLVQAKAIATRISNEQASKVMSKYKYEDLFKITKDSNRKCIYD